MENILDRIAPPDPNAPPTLEQLLAATEAEIYRQVAAARQAVVTAHKTVHGLVWRNAGDGRTRPTPAQVFARLGPAGMSLLTIGRATVDFLNTVQPGLGDELEGIPSGYVVEPELAEGQPTGRVTVRME